METPMTETAFYAVKYRPFDGANLEEDLFCHVRRGWFEGDPQRGAQKDTENGTEVRVRYRLKKKLFEWEKTSNGKVTESTAREDYGDSLTMRGPDGALRSVARFDTGHRWLQTAYYDGEKAPAAMLRAKGDGMELLLRGEGGRYTRTALVACPYETGTARQSLVNAAEGEPEIIAFTELGTRCYCTVSEAARRKAVREDMLAAKNSRTQPEFTPIDNRPAPEPEPEPAMAILEELLPPSEPPAPTPPPSEPDYAARRELRFAPEEPEPTPAPLASAPERILLNEETLRMAMGQLNEAVFGEPEIPAAPKEIKEEEIIELEEIEEIKIAETPASKYGVAAKGLDGDVISAFGEAPLCETPLCETPLGEAPLMGIKATSRIVVSAEESYLYFGRMLDGLREGRGRTEQQSGATAYEGGFKADKRDGFGTYYYKSGKLCYAGGWKQNRREGAGVAFSSRDGSLFVGKWRGNLPTGVGAAFDADGNLLYTGEWRDGEPPARPAGR